VGLALVMLADELGSDHIAADQLQSVLLDEAQLINTVPRLLRDLLVRELREPFRRLAAVLLMSTLAIR
jgi:hypothetical protein